VLRIRIPFTQYSPVAPEGRRSKVKPNESSTVSILVLTAPFDLIADVECA
jgi:hypothetical protein